MDGQGDRTYRCLEEIDSGGGTAYWNLCLGYWVDAAVGTDRAGRPLRSVTEIRAVTDPVPTSSAYPGGHGRPGR